jgi:hypothetical protein
MGGWHCFVTVRESLCRAARLPAKMAHHDQ